jgi:hypothetical protein
MLMAAGNCRQGDSSWVTRTRLRAAIVFLVLFEYGTFEDYCRQRWGFGRLPAWRNISAAEVHCLIASVPSMPLPNCEAQVRPLVGAARSYSPIILGDPRREGLIAKVQEIDRLLDPILSSKKKRMVANRPATSHS